jgi:hypothetical protein
VRQEGAQRSSLADKTLKSSGADETLFTYLWLALKTAVLRMMRPAVPETIDKGTSIVKSEESEIYQTKTG